MAHISDYLEEALLNHVFRNVPLTSPATVYVAIFSDVATQAELEAGTLTNEITGYAEANRPAVPFGAPTQVGGKATISNSAAVEFTNMPAVTVAFVAIMDSAAKGGGNVLYGFPMTENKIVNSGDTFRLPAGEIDLDLD